MSRAIRHLGWLRFAQASPLLAGALCAVIWFSVPAWISATVMSTLGQLRGVSNATASRSELVDLMRAQEVGSAARLFGDRDSLETATTVAYERWIASLPARIRESDILSSPVAPDPALFDPIAKWERANGARVWAWTVMGPPQPSLAATAFAEPALLRALEDDLSASQAAEPDQRSAARA